MGSWANNRTSVEIIIAIISLTIVTIIIAANYRALPSL